MQRITDKMSPALIQELLDRDELSCSFCERPAYCTRGPYGDVALCEECDGAIPMDDLDSNFGEFPTHGIH